MPPRYLIRRMKSMARKGGGYAGGPSRSGSLGSPMHREAMHGGKIRGAGEVQTGGPGKFAKSVRTEGQGNRDAKGLDTRGGVNPGGDAPKGMSIYRQGDPPPKGYKQ